jgi:hypothetical protein
MNCEQKKKKIWFPAKRYGWGWGLPCTREGWVVMVTWLLLLVGAAVTLMPEHPIYFEVTLGVLTGFLIAVCWWKGEKARWRWGKDS